MTILLSIKVAFSDYLANFVKLKLVTLKREPKKGSRARLLFPVVMSTAFSSVLR